MEFAQTNPKSHSPSHQPCFDRVAGGWRPRPRPPAEDLHFNDFMNMTAEFDHHNISSTSSSGVRTRKSPSPRDVLQSSQISASLATTTPAADVVRILKRPRAETHLAGSRSNWVSKVRAGDHARSRSGGFAPAAGSSSADHKRDPSGGSLRELLLALDLAAAVASDRREDFWRTLQGSTGGLPYIRDADETGRGSFSAPEDEEEEDNVAFGSPLLRLGIASTLARRRNPPEVIPEEVLQRRRLARRRRCPSVEVGLPHVLSRLCRACAEAEQTGSLDPADKPRKQALYADALIDSPEVQDQADKCSIPAELLDEFAVVFAELDTRFTGRISLSQLGYLMSRLGLCIDPQVLAAILDELFLESGIQAVDFLDLLDVARFLRYSQRVSFVRSYNKRQGPNLEVSYSALASILEETWHKAQTWQLEKVVEELRLELNSKSEVVVRSEDDLAEIADKVRNLERQRYRDRAGFTIDQVDSLKESFQRQARGSSELLAMGLPTLLRSMGCHGCLDQMDYSEGMPTVTFLQVLHLGRRLMDEELLETALEERHAAMSAEVPMERVDELRALYIQMVGEEAANHQRRKLSKSAHNSHVKGRHSKSSSRKESSDDMGFLTFPYLVKAATSLGARLGPDELKELEVIFNEFATECEPRHSLAPVPSSSQSHRKSAMPGNSRASTFYSVITDVETFERQSLDFLAFLRVIGRLWKENFASILVRPPSVSSSEGARRTRNLVGAIEAYCGPTLASPLPPVEA